MSISCHMQWIFSHIKSLPFTFIGMYVYSQNNQYLNVFKHYKFAVVKPLRNDYIFFPISCCSYISSGWWVLLLLESYFFLANCTFNWDWGFPHLYPETTEIQRDNLETLPRWSYIINAINFSLSNTPKTALQLCFTMIIIFTWSWNRIVDSINLLMLVLIWINGLWMINFNTLYWIDSMCNQTGYKYRYG